MEIGYCLLLKIFCNRDNKTRKKPEFAVGNKNIFKDCIHYVFEQ